MPTELDVPASPVIITGVTMIEEYPNVPVEAPVATVQGKGVITDKDS